MFVTSCIDESSGGNRPQPAGRGYVSIFAGGAPGHRFEWPVFGEQIVGGTGATRPVPVMRESSAKRSFEQ